MKSIRRSLTLLSTMCIVKRITGQNSSFRGRRPSHKSFLCFSLNSFVKGIRRNDKTKRRKSGTEIQQQSYLFFNWEGLRLPGREMTGFCPAYYSYKHSLWKAPQAIYQRWWYSEWKQNTTKKKEMIFTTTLAAVKRTCETRWKLFYRLFFTVFSTTTRWIIKTTSLVDI